MSDAPKMPELPERFLAAIDAAIADRDIRITWPGQSVMELQAVRDYIPRLQAYAQAHCSRIEAERDLAVRDKDNMAKFLTDQNALNQQIATLAAERDALRKDAEGLRRALVGIAHDCRLGADRAGMSPAGVFDIARRCDQALATRGPITPENQDG